MSIITEVMDLESAGLEPPGFTLQWSHHVDKMSGLWSLVFPLKDRLICSVQSRQYLCTHPNYTPLGFIMCACDLAYKGCSAPPVVRPLPFPSEQIWSGSEQSGPEPLHTKERCKMAPRRKSETCTCLSAVGNNFRLCCISGLALISGWHKGRQGLWNEFCVLG